MSLWETVCGGSCIVASPSLIWVVAWSIPMQASTRARPPLQGRGQLAERPHLCHSAEAGEHAPTLRIYPRIRFHCVRRTFNNAQIRRSGSNGSDLLGWLAYAANPDQELHLALTACRTHSRRFLCLGGGCMIGLWGCLCFSLCLLSS
jgi:hypothetical protein